jgi:glycosyltransferase involved in cell wall biosynthesis
MIRVLELGMGWFPEQAGGLNRVYHELVRSLPEAGVDVSGVVTGSGLSDRESQGRIRSVVSSDVGLRRRWKAIRSGVAEAIQQQKPDLVAAHFAVYTWPALRAIGDIPLVVHFHGPWAAEGRREGAGRFATAIKTLLERRVYRRAARLIVLSQAFKDVLCHSYGVDASRVDIVPGGVDCKRYDVALSRDQARAKLHWPADRHILLAVRRLVHRMGLEDLITATTELRRKHPDLLIFIAGKGPIAPLLQQHIDDAGLADHVKLLGYVSDADLPVAYAAADISVVPTVALEGFGLIAIESLAAGTPVIVTPVGGLPEVVRGLSTSLITDGTGPHALVRAIGAALADPSRLPTREACKQYTREHFDLPVIARRTKSVYESAIEPRTR